MLSGGGLDNKSVYLTVKWSCGSGELVWVGEETPTGHKHKSDSFCIQHQQQHPVNEYEQQQRSSNLHITGGGALSRLRIGP